MTIERDGATTIENCMGTNRRNAHGSALPGGVLWQRG